MLKFAKSVSYIPDPTRSRPFIPDSDKHKAAADPPQVVPFHCKPWLDGQTVGWTLFYGYLTPITISVGANDRIHVQNLEKLAQESNQPRVIEQFAAGHFGLGTGYTLQTPPGFVTLLLPASQPPMGLEALPGIVESDWYPRQLFAVFAVPAAGVSIKLDYKTPLLRVVVIPRHEQLVCQPLNESELTLLSERRATYIAEEETTPSRWTSDSGHTFTHLYKQWSSHYRQEKKSDL